MKKLSLLLVALLLLLAACTEDDSATEEETQKSVTTVEVDEVTQGDITIDKSFYGRTSPVQTTPVMAPMAGELDSLDVENGEQVKEDDDLLTIIGAETGRSMTITASNDGEITSLSAKEGDMVSTENAIAVIADLSELTVELTVTANNLRLFEEDAEVDVHFSDAEDETTATVDYIGTLPNDTGLYPIELTLDNEDNQWQPGIVAEVVVPENTVEDTLIVPTTAIVDEDDASYVYVVNEDNVTKTEITVTESQTNQTAIEGELSEGDQVVTSGQLTLSDGAKISISDGEDNAS
ncbi:efflux RND transporter periplasmic adaptor subunit [Paraliobacillus ryukyuensis]|uniref:efflux RND transporter periplasmic adaptor subunit n=1 Tax=Paraliobacillus ryukyuensis TaxID=200904 RepID=UPI0009A89E67|nr:efflux RND transporter periplasmic adaptor subunit [Paraliobacillus ryukyuensis]